MESKAIRTVVIMGVLTLCALTLLMMFSLNQVADTQTPQIAAQLSKELHRALAPAPPANVRLSMVRSGRGIDAARTYELRIRPSAAVSADERALARLMFRASELCAAEIGELRAEARIRCTAELPQGGEKEATFVKDRGGDALGLALIHAEGAAAPVAPAGGRVPEASKR